MTAKDRETYLPVATGCMARKLRMLNRRVTNIYDDALRGHGLKVSQVNVLVAVAVLGPTSQAAVAEGLMLEKSTLSRNLDRLHQQGWIAIEEGEDGRSHALTLTRAGRRKLDGILPQWQEAQRQVTELLGEQNLGAVDRMLESLSPPE